MEDTPLSGEGFEGDPGSGEVTEEPTQSEAPTEPERQYVEVDDPDNRYVRVKVDGEDQEVPYSEVTKGYSREADYTRKAQEVARLRQEADFGMRVQQALESNPKLALTILAERYGVEFAQQVVDQQQQPPEEDYADPLERGQAELQAQVRALEHRLQQRDEDERLDRVVYGLRSQFQISDEDLNAVVATAQRFNLEPEALPMVYKTMQFDRLQARVQAARARDEQTKADNTRRQAAAASASGVITTGSSANGLTERVDVADSHLTIREAIEASLAEHGL